MEECLTICLQTDLSVSGRHEPAKVHKLFEVLVLITFASLKISRVNLAPTDREKKMMLAGMRPRSVCVVARF